MTSPSAKELHRLFFANQLWETIAFLAKAAFLVLLTPAMLRQWGASGYGEFALASSGFVLLSALLDCGLRPQMRIALCHSWLEQDKSAYRLAFCAALSALLVVIAIALSSMIIFLWLNPLSLSARQAQLALVTTGMTGLVLLSGMLVEPLAAQGDMAMFKLAHAGGSLLAIFAGYFCLRSSYSVSTMVVAWLGSLVLANLALFVCSRLRQQRLWLGFRDVRLRDLRDCLRNGSSFFVINATWLAKTHGLTLVVSAISGAVAAGTFFILLRVSEVIGTLAAVASDAVIPAIASSKTLEGRRSTFAEAYRQVTVLSTHAALVIILLLPALLPWWLGSGAGVETGVVCAMAVFGLANAFNRIVAGAAMGLGRVDVATRWGVLEAAVSIFGVMVAQSLGGLSLSFTCAALGAVCLLPVAAVIARELQQGIHHTWLTPVLGSLVGTLIVCVCALFVALVNMEVLLFAVAGLIVLSAGWQVLRHPPATAIPMTGLLTAE